MIARPTIGLFVVFLILYLVYINRKKFQTEFKKIGLMVLCICLPILPVTAYNYSQTSEIIPIAAYGGINFYIGNYDGADGVSAVIPGVRPDWQGGKEDTKRIAEKEMGRSLSESEQSTYWFGKTVNDVSSDPLRWLGLLRSKIRLLINGFELSNNFDFYYFAHQTTLMKILLHRSLLFFPFGLLFALGVLGYSIQREKKTKQKILLIYMLTTAVSIVMFLVTARYRLYMVPPLILFASYAIIHFKNEWKVKNISSKVSYIIIFLGLILYCNSDYNDYSKTTDAHGLHTTASIYNKLGNLDSASVYYQKALDVDSNQIETLNDYALLFASHNIYPKPFKLLEHAITLPNKNFMTHYNLGYVYMQVDKLDEAK